MDRECEQNIPIGKTERAMDIIAPTSLPPIGTGPTRHPVWRVVLQRGIKKKGLA